MALGAQRADIVGLVLRQGMQLAGIGIVLGVIGAAALTRVMASLLFGMNARDAITFTSASLILAVVALWACFVPARRASSIDPIAALREE
jgi:putative ABC transport system permease protein